MLPVPAAYGYSKAEPIQTKRKITTAAMVSQLTNCLPSFLSVQHFGHWFYLVAKYNGLFKVFYQNTSKQEIRGYPIWKNLGICYLIVTEKLNYHRQGWLSCNPLMTSPMPDWFLFDHNHFAFPEWRTDKGCTYILCTELIHLQAGDMSYNRADTRLCVASLVSSCFVYAGKEVNNSSWIFMWMKKVISVLDRTQDVSMELY